MKFAIRVEETKGKTFIVEADSLDEAIDKMECAEDIDLSDEESEREVSCSPYAYVGGFATPEQIENCEHYD